MSQNLLAIVSRALRLIGQLEGAATPPGDQSADLLAAANAMKRGWFGTLIGPRLSPFAISGATGQAESGGEYLIGGTAAMTLGAPANPRPGARFGVVDGGVGFAAHNLTVSGAGALIGGAATAVLNTNGAAQRWWFRPDAASWTTEADWPSLNVTPEFPDVIAVHFAAMLAIDLAGEFGQDIPAEVAVAAGEGRMAMARTYARRGPFGLDPVIGLTAPAPQPAPAR